MSARVLALCVRLSVLLSGAVACIAPAHAEDTAKPASKGESFWAEYTQNSLGVGLVGREGVYSGTAAWSFSRRDEIGWVASATQTRVGVAGNTIGWGVWGEVGWTLNGVFLRDKKWSMIGGVGPAFELSFLPGASAHLGVNVLTTFGVEQRKDGLARGLSFTVTASVPTTVGTDDRQDPLVTLSVGGITPSKLTVAKASRKATRRSTPRAPVGPAAPTVVVAAGEPTPPPKPPPVANLGTCEIVTLQPSLFGDNSAQPLEESDAVIASVAQVMLENPQVELLRLEGHTDSRGSGTYNRQLSTWRVEAVTSALVEFGVPAERLSGVGFGEDRPRVPDARTEEEHAQNRRVVFRVVRGMNCVATE